MGEYYTLSDILFVVWLVLVGPAHGLLFAQVPPRLGARPLRWTESIKYGIAFFGALFVSFYVSMIISLGNMELAAAIAFVLAILLFAWEYRRVLEVPFTTACLLAFVQAILFLATLGVVTLLFELEGFLL
ncbi:MAG: hypothetical protein IT368_03455 [Candidatus Hydrogenedentes bacterium]|nr:hypothetical protein [Candidatus Hydrogenedentota bacterium]